MYNKYNSPNKRRTPFGEIMIQRCRVFGCFLTTLARKMRFGIKKLCAICGISESHTFRGKMMKGIEVDFSIYQMMYVALKSVLVTRPTRDYQLMMVELEENFNTFTAPVQLHMFAIRNRIRKKHEKLVV